MDVLNKLSDQSLMLLWDTYKADQKRAIAINAIRGELERRGYCLRQGGWDKTKCR